MSCITCSMQLHPNQAHPTVAPSSSSPSTSDMLPTLWEGFTPLASHTNRGKGSNDMGCRRIRILKDTIGSAIKRLETDLDVRSPFASSEVLAVWLAYALLAYSLKPTSPDQVYRYTMLLRCINCTIVIPCIQDFLLKVPDGKGGGGGGRSQKYMFRVDLTIRTTLGLVCLRTAHTWTQADLFQAFLCLPSLASSFFFSSRNEGAVYTDSIVRVHYDNDTARGCRPFLLLLVCVCVCVCVCLCSTPSEITLNR